MVYTLIQYITFKLPTYFILITASNSSTTVYHRKIDNKIVQQIKTKLTLEKNMAAATKTLP